MSDEDPGGISQAAPNLHADRPHPARVYDFLLGGKDNFAADRAAAEQGLRANPNSRIPPRENRAFLRRVVRYLAGEVGIRQFLDIGTGIPTSPNVHEVAQSVAPDARIVVQVSRWDRLKDPVGVLEAFGRGIAPKSDAVLVLAGPAVSAVDDDPEQPEVLNAVASCRESLPAGVRDRVLIAQLPMVNIEENATMVNALQRRADIVVQKSLAEGYGLTVAEAMWKTRPMVAGRVGGIEEQIEDGKSGLLIDDARDLESFAAAVDGLLHDPARAAELGQGARRRAIAQLIVPRHLVAQARLVMSLLG